MFLFQIYGRPPKNLTDRSVKSYETYKKVVLFFALIDQLYALLFDSADSEIDSDWPANLAEWIRNNDDEIMKKTAKVLSTFQVIFKHFFNIKKKMAFDIRF